MSLKALEVPPAVEEVYEKNVPNKKGKDSQEVNSGEAVPTAMEMALREAMDRTKDDEEIPVTPEQQSPDQNDAELEQILERTLHNRVKTSK